MSKCNKCAHLIAHPTRGCKLTLCGKKTYVDNEKCMLFVKRFEPEPKKEKKKK